MSADGTPGGPNKVALAVRSDLAAWQQLNVVAFLTSGFGHAAPETIGLPYADGDGRSYPPMLAVPVRVFSGEIDPLRRAFGRAVERDLHVSVYIEDMFETMNDDDNRAAVAAYPTSDLPLVGFAVAGPGKQVDKAFDKLKLYGS